MDRRSVNTHTTVTMEHVEARPLATLSMKLGPGGVPAAIIALLDRVWPALRASGVRTGHNVVIYRDRASIEAGVEVFGDVPPELNASATPSGRVATAAHIGPYDQMARTNDAIVAFCKEHGLALAGTSWEVYGDWDEDPSRLRTDVCYLLA
jgi:effector-binding domain-containing protein